MTSSEAGASEIGDLTASVAAAAARAGWHVTVIPHTPDTERHLLLAVDRPSRPVDHPVVVAVHTGSRSVVCHSIMPRRFDGPSMSRIIEFTTRANSGLVEGNFEVDLDDGEVRFKTSFHVVATARDDQVAAALDHALEFNLAVFDLYGDDLERCADGSLAPGEAVRSAEHG